MFGWCQAASDVPAIHFNLITHQYRLSGHERREHLGNINLGAGEHKQCDKLKDKSKTMHCTVDYGIKRLFYADRRKVKRKEKKDNT
jgi:hypothetical protein